jgi:hypothetical protein
VGTGTRALESFGVRGTMEGAVTGGAGGGDGARVLSLSFPLKSLINPDFLCFKVRGGGAGAESSELE